MPYLCAVLTKNTFLPPSRRRPCSFFIITWCVWVPPVTKLMEMHGDNTVEDVGMEVEREDEKGEEVADE